MAYSVFSWECNTSVNYGEHSQLPPTFAITSLLTKIGVLHPVRKLTGSRAFLSATALMQGNTFPLHLFKVTPCGQISGSLAPSALLSFVC